MGINLHLLAHRSYPYIDNLHIYAVKRWQKHKKMAFVLEGEKKCEWKSATNKLNSPTFAFAFALAFQLFARVFCIHTLHSHSIYARCLMQVNFQKSKSMMRIDFLLANIRFFMHHEILKQEKEEKNAHTNCYSFSSAWYLLG